MIRFSDLCLIFQSSLISPCLRIVEMTESTFLVVTMYKDITELEVFPMLGLKSQHSKVRFCSRREKLLSRSGPKF